MIRFDNVTKQYRGSTRPALNNVSFEILRGEFVFLVGASGSGKSSCLRLIIKEDKPTRGAIHVLGQNLGTISSRKIPFFRRSLGVVFQDFRLLPNKTVHENVAFSLQVIGKSKGYIQSAVPDVLKMVGLAGKASRYPHELSGGEQQRVAIARAIVNKPALLLADEPTGNLDPATSAGIMSLLEAINAGGTTVVMATHAADFVDRMKKRVIELSAGQIVRDERDAGYGHTAAMPIVGGETSVNATGEIPRLARRSAKAKTGPISRPPVAANPIIETTDLVVPRVHLEGTTGLDEMTLDAVPELPSQFSVQASDDTDDLSAISELFAMNDSQAVPRIDPENDPRYNAGVPSPEDLARMTPTQRLKAQAKSTARSRTKNSPEKGQDVGPVS
jgi:cell division transport system ATP-binding protein